MNGDSHKMLFSTGKIGSLELKNRMVMPPMVTNYATEDGAVTEQYKDYLRERAKGGVGLIIVEATYVHPWGKGFVNNLGIDRDELVPGLRELTEVAHGADDPSATICIQSTDKRLRRRMPLLPKVVR